MGDPEVTSRSLLDGIVNLIRIDFLGSSGGGGVPLATVMDWVVVPDTARRGRDNDMDAAAAFAGCIWEVREARERRTRRSGMLAEKRIMSVKCESKKFADYFFQISFLGSLKYGVAQEMALLYDMYVLLQGMMLLQQTLCERKTCRSDESGKPQATEYKGNLLLMICASLVLYIWGGRM